MSAEWKSGQVAMVSGTEGTRRAVRRGGVWINLDSEGYVIDAYVEKARPLVVIDPEDREAVERLVEVLVRFEGPGPATFADRIQLALREFAAPTPPKPDEPQGLGAVVEDAEGLLWLRWWAEGSAHPSSTRPWQCANGMGSDREWSEVSAVRVLSEGVTP